MKIGIFGGGSVGGTLGQAFAHKGHDVLFGVRQPDAADVKDLLSRCEGRGRAGTTAEAAAFWRSGGECLAVGSIQARIDLGGFEKQDPTGCYQPALAELGWFGSWNHEFRRRTNGGLGSRSARCEDLQYNGIQQHGQSYVSR